MKTVTLFLVLLAGLTGLGAQAIAQRPATADARLIELAVAKHIRSFAGGADARFDSRVWVKGDPVVERDDTQRRALATAMGVPLGQREAVIQCDDTRRPPCRVAGAKRLITLGAPVMHGDTARVWTQFYDQTSIERMPIAQAATEWLLVREGSRWVVRGKAQESIS
jgi:hypothetical protein